MRSDKKRQLKVKMKKKMKKKISVIVPVYNSGKYLKRCIDSILSQSYNDFELILVNDGSTDRSGEICKSFKDPRIRYFEQNNKGVSSARNVGIKECSGEFVTFADSDDMLLKDYLMTLVSLQEKYGTDITICTFSDRDEDGKCVDIYSPEWRRNRLIRGSGARTALTDKILSNTGNKRPAMSPYCKLYRADIIKNNGIIFDEKLPVGEDVLFNLTYAQHIDSLLYIKSVQYFRTVREGSAVMSCRPEIYKELKELLQAYFSIKKRFDIAPKTEKAFIFDKVNDSLGLYVFRSRDIKELNNRTRELYRFIGSDTVAPVWSSISSKDISGSRDKLKLFLVNAHLVGLWSLLKKYR